MKYKRRNSSYKSAQNLCNGILLVDKPEGWTSHDVVNFIRIKFNITKAGHCGTLDPRATGLLVLVLGKFTKLSAELSGQDKIYDCRILLGITTDSYDMDGKITGKKECSHITEGMVKEVLKNFIGPQKQIPPMLSAVKKNGKPLYKLARKGIEVKRDPKNIIIHEIELKSFDHPTFDIRVHCSKGTYIRTLAHNIGEKLNCGAVLENLVRIRSGEFSITQAVDIDSVRKWSADDLEKHVREITCKYFNL